MLCPLILALLAPFLAILLPEAVGNPYSKGLWQTCTVNEAALTANTNLQKETLSGISRVRCISMAAIREWPYLSCWTEGSQCTLWGLQALVVGVVVPGPKLHANCLMPADFVGCVDAYGSKKLGLIPEFEVGCDDGYTYGCVNGKYQIKVTPSQLLTSCSAPFSSTPHGCIFVNTELLSWSAARLTCLTYGSDLFVPSSAQAYVRFTNYLGANYAGIVGDVWIGVQMLPDARWQWLDGRSLDPIEAPNILNPDGDLPYARAQRFSATKQILMDTKCASKFASTCQLKDY